MSPENVFSAIGIDETNIKNLLKNAQKTNTLVKVVEESGLLSRIEKNEDCTKYGALLLPIAVGLAEENKILVENRKLAAEYVAQNKLKNVVQVDAAVKFVKERAKKTITAEEFEKATGVGVEVKPEQVTSAIAQFITEKKDQLLADRDEKKLGALFGQLRRRMQEIDANLQWAEAKSVKEEFETQIKSLWSSAPAPAAAAPAEAKPKAAPTTTTTTTSAEEEKKVSRKFEARELESAKNTAELLEKHKAATGGKIVTRFPPEPNGFLHVGHAKAMNLSFGYAAEEGGYTILRFDDTNPEGEEQIYFDSIHEMVAWLGFKPAKVTHTSDYFPQMYEFAVRLIKEGKAFVDFSSKEEIKKQRDEKRNSPYRDTDPATNLKHFEDMKKGKYEEGKAVLRVKIDMEHPNPNMRDFIAYRIKYVRHAQTGDQWCIYPSYDFSHCIVDSLENITHSLCTLEFEIRRDPYYWVLEALNMYRPHVWEFSRLNIKKSMLSKRKLNKMVKEGIIRGWDDPRMLSLAGLRRRGYRPEGLLAFCNEIGVSRNDNLIPMERLEQSCRLDLDEAANRVFVVLEPLKVVLTNYPEGKVEMVKAPNHPKKPEYGERQIPFTRVVYIDKKDFREQDSKDFFGLAPNKEVGLKAAYNITCTEVIKNKNGEIVELRATVDLEKKNKPKGHIHWLPEHESVKKAEVRLYENLFNDDVPDAHEDWMHRINPNSEVIVKDALIDPWFNNKEHCAVFSHYQFERLGYFVIDTDTKEDHLVFNRTVTLKESKALEESKHK